MTRVQPHQARVASGVRLPDLRIVPSGALLLHEACDPARVERLAKALTADGVLRNPPIVAPMDAQTFVVLDGANRVTALQQAGLPHQAVQVVDYDDQAVRLDVWAHLLQDDGLLVAGDAMVGAQWQTMPPEAVREELEHGTLVCGLVTAAAARGLRVAGEFADRVRALGEVVARYVGRTPIYRVPSADLHALAEEYGRAAALVLFPRFTKADIRAIARLPVKLPSGISRHIIPQRALRVNVDLALLAGPEPTAVKQARFDQVIRARLLEHRVRHYPEPTVLYDE
ncbi:MAG: ParB N-terminal domain-containing protein [Armatimonadota bacterium]|nr:ParB N-terminal domain-containing protein [Armatimonadota bacterium]